MLLFLLAATTILIFGFPTPALAWGPATHIEFATHALEQIALFTPLVKKLLQRYPDHFLYGSIAADITLVKGLRGYLYNCHNWRIPLELFHQKASKHHQKAFALGYLGHLAADTVAHNFFIPFKLIRSWRTRLLKHVYWEMRMDLSIPEKYWHRIEELKSGPLTDNDRFLEEHLKRTFFSFKTNKKIFNSLIVLQRLRHYRKIAQKVAKKSIFQLSDSEMRTYKKLSLDAVIDFLKHFEKSYCLRADPTGKLKMLYARDMVKKMRQAQKKKLLHRDAEQHLLRDVKKQLGGGIYEVVPLPALDAYLD